VTSRPLLITDEDLARVEEEIALATRGESRPDAGPTALPKAREFIAIRRPKPQGRAAAGEGIDASSPAESQDSELRVPEFLIRRPEQDAPPPAEAPASRRGGEPGKVPAARSPRVSPRTGMRTVSPYHVAWLVPLLAVLACLLLGRVLVLPSLMMAAAVGWAFLLSLAMAARAERELLPCLRTATVLQTVLASAAAFDWLSRGMPAFGLSEWLAVCLLPLMGAAMAFMERGCGRVRP